MKRARIRRIRIRFLKPWGHPTKNLICETGTVAIVSEWIANILVRDGYAERIIQ